MPLRIVTWNINSVRLRAGLLDQIVAELDPDVICLQEIKCREEQFPLKAVRKLGYDHVAINGQKGYHGVATLSRVPIADTAKRTFCNIDEARHIATDLDTGSGLLRLHNFYIPAGGDEPDPDANPKFAHKLAFLDELTSLGASDRDMLHGTNGAVLVGDLNVAPSEFDVWSHKQLLKIVSHTPEETSRLDRARDEGGWRDVVRQHRPDPEKLFSWWSYRARDWQASNRGRRLDHIWISDGKQNLARDSGILTHARGWEKPSDHVPIWVDLDV
ncbi:MAG: exodeoxyribonuclease III [Pseudomonadota bacterium]